MPELSDDPRWWQDAVIYQIYPRSFRDADGDGVGDLAGIVQQLDHLAELGVDALWLSPIFTSPMADFGYDVADYTDVDPVFGTLGDADRLVEAFQDGDAGAAHVQSEHFRTAQETLPRYLVETPRIVSTALEQDDWSLLGELAVRDDNH